MTPMLNQLSLYQSARSFVEPDGDHRAMAREFCRKAFGPGAEAVAEYLPLFEVVPDWGNYVRIDVGREEFHRRMTTLAELLACMAGHVVASVPLHPGPEAYRAEMEWFARLFAELSGPLPHYDRLRKHYWDLVYGPAYDRFPHADPRPAMATDRLVSFFRQWRA